MDNSLSRKDTSLGAVYYVNETDLNFLFYEIVDSNSYFQDFITLNPGAVVLDVGANIGIFSLFVLKYCHYDVQLYSFEPIPSNFVCLQNNLAPYQSKAHVYNLALGNPKQDCDIEFTVFGASSLTSTYRPKDKLISNFQPFLNYDRLLQLAALSNRPLYYQLKYLPFLRSYLINRYYKKMTKEKKVICKLSSLGEFIEQHKLSCIDLLKIDVEGAEVDVLLGIKSEQFSMIKQLCIEVHNIDNRVKNVEHFLKTQGYETHVHRNPFFVQFGLNHHMIYGKRSS